MPQIPSGFGQNRGILFFAEDTSNVERSDLLISNKIPESSNKLNIAFNPVNLSFFGISLGTVACVDLGVTKP